MVMSVIPTMKMKIKNEFSVEKKLNTPHLPFQLDGECEIY